ncbi:hypothetical protein OJ997_26250 [Solirubrobacter phytolaccae]|uniref:Uncharacterized protein n=1 Tax=Solirubrobacter phytolaccae TaxID=1404360 RepID=A0A9X3NBX1_9ACTN|nr:hypothetical protein [Solirubrobacter phytolaccae]MDA0183835.1 hypothetical protein [Solirubrobacter phytolaccae]
MEPIYRIVPGEPGTSRIERVDQLRLLTPGEREEARRRREEKREENAKRPPKRPSAQEPRGGVDYTA